MGDVAAVVFLEARRGTGRFGEGLAEDAGRLDGLGLGAGEDLREVEGAERLGERGAALAALVAEPPLLG
jgi:hypothetical protein